MAASRYDIYAEQGSTLKLHLWYKYSGGTGINLANFRGEMQVRRSSKDPNVLLYFTNNGVTGGGITGDFSPGTTQGVGGVGGISFNTDIYGNSGFTGGIYIRADATTMKNLPYGKHFYDLELTSPVNEVMRFIEGSFEVPREITR